MPSPRPDGAGVLRRRRRIRVALLWHLCGPRPLQPARRPSGRDVPARPRRLSRGSPDRLACALARGDTGEALVHARLACEVAPLSAQASLHLAQCLEAAGSHAARPTSCVACSRSRTTPRPSALATCAWRSSVAGGPRARRAGVLSARVLASRRARARCRPRRGGAHRARGGRLQRRAFARAGRARAARRGHPARPHRGGGDVLMEASRAAVDAELFAWAATWCARSAPSCATTSSSACTARSRTSPTDDGAGAGGSLAAVLLGRDL